MAYDGKLLARARGKLENIRADNQAENRRRTDQVYAKVPEIREIDAKLRGQMAELVSLTLSRKSDMQQQLAALKERNLDLQMRKAELLVANGWPVEYLDEIVSCSRCRDSGTFEGKPCSCLEKLYNQELTKELGVLLRNGNESFENFDLNLYSNELDLRSQVIPRQAMAAVRDVCRKYADNFPQVSSNLLLQGGTGVGKTYLSACIARVVASKGCSVCYDSAASALEAFERQKFSRDPEEAEAAADRVQRMLSCDLLILDDLGTEMVTPMSISALYTLLNTRLIHGSKIIINTNLDYKDMAQKYTPQICSRLQGEFLRLPFVGDDIRLKKHRI